MGKKSRTTSSSAIKGPLVGDGGGREKSDGGEGSLMPLDRGTLAQCLNATSQIAAECNSILRDLLRGRYVESMCRI